MAKIVYVPLILFIDSMKLGNWISFDQIHYFTYFSSIIKLNKQNVKVTQNGKDFLKCFL
jgi:hypothetical protein